MPNAMSKKTIRKTTAPKIVKRAPRDADGNVHFSRAKGPAPEPRPPIIQAFMDDDSIVVDNFAGGGGASSGVVRALRGLGWDKEPDIAINHDAEAIAMHKKNHPNTRHYIEDVWKVSPTEACGGRPVGLAWFSPTCTHFSKAKGTALDESSVKIRGLCWVAVRWAAEVSPRVICMENVEEWQKFGPLHRDHTDGCNGKNGVGKECKKTCRIHKPIKEKEGSLFKSFIRRLEKLGYVVEYRILKAADYGAPTTRKRLFLVARRDGLPIAWPVQTHAPKDDPRVKSGELLPHVGAKNVINWAIPCPSIFERDRPLADKTMARIARGIQKFVLDNPTPFIVPVSYGSKGGPDDRGRSIDLPMPTICGNRGGHAIAVPYLVHRSNGERPEVVKPDGTVIAGQAPRIYDVENPLGTIVAGGQKHAVSVAYLMKNNGGNNDKAGCAMGESPETPMPTIACRDQKSLVAAHLVKLRGTSEAHIASSASSVEEPVPTVSASGTHVAAVAAFLTRYNGESVGQTVDGAIGTLDTTDRYGLVTVTFGGEEYVIVDIGLRMLTPRELYDAQGFDPDYIIEFDYEGKPLTKTAQIRMVGNSVPPIMAEKIARAQLEAA